MKLKAKIISVSPEQSGLRKDNSQWKSCNAILQVEEDRFVVRAWDEESDFCQTYDLATRPDVEAEVKFDIGTSVRYGDRKYQEATLKTIKTL